MLNLQITVNGKEKVIADLENLSGKAKNLRPAFKVAGGFILESTQRTFMAGGRPERWAPLSPVTILLRKHGGNIPLHDRGILKTSIGIMELSNGLVRVGTSEPQAKLLHFGGEAKGFIKGHPRIPARPFMHLLPEDVENIVKVFMEHIAGDVAK